MTTPLNLDAQLDRDLRARLRVAALHEATPRWRDVERRARALTREHPRRRLALAIAIAAVAVAVPAFAVASGVIDFSSSPSAPEPIKVLFGKLDSLDPRRGPKAMTGQTRLVYTFHTDSGSYELAVAPARDGWCWSIVGRDLTCNTPKSGLNYGYNPPPAVGNQPLLIDGSIAAAGVTRIAIEFEDGRSVDVPFVQVSAPIDADFFLYEVDPANWKPGRRPATIAAYDSGDTVVGSGWFIRESDAPVVGTKG